MADPSSQNKKGWIRLLGFVGGIVTGIVVLIATGLFGPIYTHIHYLIYPPKLELSVTECIIYRVGPHDFPSCEIQFTAYNPTDRDVTADLKQATFFRDNIVYTFEEGQEILKVSAKHKISGHVKFQSLILDRALKVPQDSSTAMLKLTYEYTATRSKDDIALTDKDVIKCSYWQTGVFGSSKETRDMGLYALPSVVRKLYYTDKTGKQGSDVQDITFFTDRNGLLDFNLREFQKWVTFEKVDWVFYWPAFRRRYGGTYLGMLESDTTGQQHYCFPHDLLAEISDYDEYILLGMNLKQDFSGIKEFIYYNFDRTKENPLFRICQENSEFYILLIYEDHHDIPKIVDSLTMLGYRVGTDSTKRLGKFEDIANRITPKGKVISLAQEFNNYVDSLNSVIRHDGIFVFFPDPPDSERINRIIENVKEASGKSICETLSFDCTPLQALPKAALYLTPVLVFLNFSDTTMVGGARIEWR